MNDRESNTLPLNAVCKRFGLHEALHNLSLTISPCEVYAPLGPNGAGKTTTLNLILGFVFPDKGSITLNGDNTAKNSIQVRKSIAYLPETVIVRPELYDHIHWISFDYSSAWAVNLLKDYAIFAGLSTGACYTVAQWCHKDLQEPCLFLGADTGHRYLDAIFKDKTHLESVCDFRPKFIENIENIKNMEMPWSTIMWNRQLSFSQRLQV